MEESRERVRSAIRNSGFSFPMARLTVNLAPADVRKERPGFDLPIALGILAAHCQAKADRPDDIVFAGELGLDGEVRALSGVLPMAIGARAAGKRAIAVPEPKVRDAAVVRGLEGYALRTLSEAAGLLDGKGELKPAADAAADLNREDVAYALGFGDVKGRGRVKRALEVAAASAHNALPLWPPGSGKTMLAGLSFACAVRSSFSPQSSQGVFAQSGSAGPPTVFLLSAGIAGEGAVKSWITFGGRSETPTRSYTATGVGANAEDRVPILIARRQTIATACAWAVARMGAAAAPSVTPVRVTAANDTTSGPGSAAAARMKSSQVSLHFGAKVLVLVTNDLQRVVSGGPHF